MGACSPRKIFGPRLSKYGFCDYFALINAFMWLLEITGSYHHHRPYGLICLSSLINLRCWNAKNKIIDLGVRDRYHTLLTIKWPITTKVVRFLICWIVLQASSTNSERSRSWSTLFASILTLVNNISKYMQQRT